jgi:hypothetical protein
MSFVKAEAQEPPKAELSNDVLRVTVYLPNKETGFYRGTRFDWSGVIASLEYAGHKYYGPWFTKTDPNVIDFVYRGSDIVAGPCSAITGPVEEFSWKHKALGYDEAKVGGTFLKIGVGMLRKPSEEKYTPYRLYEIANGGKWSVKESGDRIEFTQELNDPQTGYGYRYTKIVRLVNGKPEMALDHKLTNIGRREIKTSVYDHNFFVLDNQPPGPGLTIKFPFPLKADEHLNPELAEVRGNELIYRKVLVDHETAAAQLSGFGNTAADYHITIENSKASAGMTITGNRPLSSLYLWSIRSVSAVEPYIDMTIEPGHSFEWRYQYDYYTLK